jgi:hypothetical protein
VHLHSGVEKEQITKWIIHLQLTGERWSHDFPRLRFGLKQSVI